jgi:holo-[acyl-carrier protein] synthase
MPQDAARARAGLPRRGNPPRASVGVDLLEVERLARALDRHPRLAGRLFTDDERALASGSARRLAARFCAKEAVAKALRLEAWSWREVEVLGGDGPPELRLHGAVAARATALGVHVEISLAHSRRDAAAVALAVPV